MTKTEKKTLFAHYKTARLMQLDIAGMLLDGDGTVENPAALKAARQLADDLASRLLAALEGPSNGAV